MRIIKTMALIGVGTLIASCTSTKQTSTLSLNGKWDITSVNGKQLTDKGAYILFSDNNQMSGYSGCNRMMGTYTSDNKKSILQFSQVGCTRMMCKDMQTEQDILNALEKSKTYQINGNELTLNDSIGQQLMTITRSQPDLNGKWNIKTVKGENVQLTDGTTPYLIFDLQQQRVNGKIGDNQFNADIQTDANKLEFAQGAATMMMGPNQETEDKIKAALHEVKQYQIGNDGVLTLQNAKGEELITLQSQD
ncbi:MAG: META domain-containing protein [Bacteroidaceae bacterium]|nr:META domain-containing protein [Bacteroidaceae bacterium]